MMHYIIYKIIAMLCILHYIIYKTSVFILHYIILYLPVHTHDNVYHDNDKKDSQAYSSYQHSQFCKMYI